MKIFGTNKSKDKDVEIEKEINVDNKDNDVKLKSDVSVTGEVTDNKDVINDVKEEPVQRTRKKKEPKTYCRVLMATPSYFVINKNGEKITVEKSNDYITGQEILY